MRLLKSQHSKNDWNTSNCNLKEYHDAPSENDIFLKKSNESNEEMDLNRLYEEGLHQATNKVEACELEVKYFLKDNNLAFLRRKKNEFLKLKKDNKTRDISPKI